MFSLSMAAQSLSCCLCSTPRHHQTTRRYHWRFSIPHRQKSGWYHNMIPTTFRCSSFRNQVVCPLPADPVSAHAPDFIAIFVHIRSILAVIRPLVWYPAKARNIDLIAGLQLYGRLRCGRRRLRLRRFDRRHRLCRCGDRNGAKLLVRLCPRRFRIFLFCRCHNIRFRGSCGVRWYWGGLFLLLAPGAHSQFGSGKNTQFEPEQRANPFENVFSKTAVFPPPAIAETDL